MLNILLCDTYKKDETKCKMDYWFWADDEL